MSEKIASLFAEIGADTTKLKKGLDDTKSGLTESSSLFDKFKASSLTTWAAVGGAVTAFGMAIKKTVDDTVEYGKQVDDLSRSLGVNAEESSKLIQIADDLRIPVDQLKMGFKAALKEGVAPNIEGIKGLAKEYQALDSPVEKAQFSMKYFGRAGLELNKILELSSSEIDAMAQSAEQAGLVMDGQAVQATKDYWSAMDSLADSVEGVKVQIGIGLVPVLTQAADGTANLITRVNELNSINTILDAAYEAGNITKRERIALGLENIQGTIDENRVMKLQVDIQRSLSQEYTESLRRTVDYTKGTDDLSDGLDTLRMRTTNANDGFIEFGHAGEDVEVSLKKDKEAAKELQGRYDELRSYMDGPLGDEYDDFIQKNDDLRAKAEELRSKISELEAKEYLTKKQKEELNGLYTDLGEVTTAITDNADAHDEATKRILFNMAEQRLAIDGFSEDELDLLDGLAVKWGLIDVKTYTVAQTMNKSLEDFANGQGVKETLAEIDNVQRGLDAIPSTINVTIHVKQTGVDLPKGWKPGDPRQFGGPVSAGMPYLVGEGGPELFVPSTSGQVINNFNLTANYHSRDRQSLALDIKMLAAMYG